MYKLVLIFWLISNAKSNPLTQSDEYNYDIYSASYRLFVFRRHLTRSKKCENKCLLTEDFCPGSLLDLEGRAEIFQIFGWDFGRNNDLII